MKKGFTLIELLAVIVILAVISIIAIPNIIGLLSHSKEDAYDIQINNIKTAMKNYVSNNNFTFPNSGSIYLTLYQLANDNLIDYKINDPVLGKYMSLDSMLEIKNTGNGLEYIVNIDDNSLSKEQLDDLPILELYNDYGYSSLNLEDNIKTASYNNTNLKSSVVITKLDDTKYKYTLTYNDISISTIYNVTYYIGKVIYYNPVTGSTCLDYNEGSSSNGIKIGCMKWFVYNIDDDKVDMILDHNTTSLVSYDDISSTLKSDTSTWINTVKKTARLISADEVAKITGADTDLLWNSIRTYSDTPTIGASISYYYLDGKSGSDNVWHTPIITGDELSSYSWLYDNTYCMIDDASRGCEIIDGNTYQIDIYNNYIKGYWTSTKFDNYSWVIRDGKVDKDSLDSLEYGIRPVITVSKNIVL